jgi:hypothetical protein
VRPERYADNRGGLRKIDLREADGLYPIAGEDIARPLGDQGRKWRRTGGTGR